MQQLRDRVDVRHDPGHVRGGGEAAQLQRAIGVAAQLGREVREVDPPVVVLADRDDVGAGLAPGQLVRVVLVGPDEDDGPLRAWAIEVEHPDELVDRGRAARTAEHDDVVRGPVDARWTVRRASSRSAVVCRPVADASVCVLAYRGRTRVADRVLDERQRATGGGGVGVDQPARAERPVDDHVVADHRAADPLDQWLRLVSAPEHRGRTGPSRGAGGWARALPASPARAARGHGRPRARRRARPSRHRALEWPGLQRVRSWRDAMASPPVFATWSHRRFFSRAADHSG